MSDKTSFIDLAFLAAIILLTLPAVLKIRHLISLDDSAIAETQAPLATTQGATSSEQCTWSDEQIRRASMAATRANMKVYARPQSGAVTADWTCWWSEHAIVCNVIHLGDRRELVGSQWYSCKNHDPMSAVRATCTNISAELHDTAGAPIMKGTER